MQVSIDVMHNDHHPSMLLDGTGNTDIKGILFYDTAGNVISPPLR